MNFWVGMCRWYPGTLNLHQSYNLGQNKLKTLTSPPPKSKMRKWRVFALRAASSLIWGGWGFAVPFYFVQDCSYLPFIAANINTYASMRNMRLNEKKCKDMVINFLKYQPTVITPIQLNGIVIERVSSYQLLGVIISLSLMIGGGGGQGGHNLPLPVPRSPASRMFLSLCLPTPALYCVSPVIM